jgi:phosphoglucomutase
MTAGTGKDPGQRHASLTREFGPFIGDRIDAPATAAQKRKLAKLSAKEVSSGELAGEKITQVLDRAPANDAAFGGIKVISAGGWFAARPSGTEDIYKIYAESFHDQEHLARLLQEAQSIVDAALAGA